MNSTSRLDVKERVRLFLENVQSNDIVIPPAEKTIISHESVLDHDTHISEHGLFVCTKTHNCFSHDFAAIHCSASKGPNRLFLKIRRTDQTKQIERMATNLNGGFHLDNPGIVFYEKYSYVLFQSPTSFVEIEIAELPSELSILNQFASVVQSSFVQQFPPWDGEVPLIESKHSGMLKDVTNLKVDENLWANAKCQEDKCQITDLGELWLNLHTGYIGCGYRSEYHSMINYYLSENAIPLVVRLASITSSGDGEIFSYEEDRFVLVHNLKEHLLSIGVKLAGRTKPVKSIRTEELELNISKSSFQRHRWMGGCELERVFGPQLTGLHNPSNYCYMHASVQTLTATCNKFKSEFNQPKVKLYESAHLESPSTHHHTQATKLVTSICSGEYSGLHIPRGISTVMFKKAIDTYGHAQFSNLAPQCAFLYTQYLIDLLRGTGGDTTFSSSFDFVVQLENVFSDNRVEQFTETWNALSCDLLNVLEKRRLDPETEGEEYFPIRLQDYLQFYFEDKIVDLEDCVESVTRRTAMVTFPEILLIQLGQKEDPDSLTNYRKLRVPAFNVPILLDLKKFKCTQNVHSPHLPDQPESLSPELQAAVEQFRNSEPNASIDDAKIALDRWDLNVQKALAWYRENQQEFSLARLVRATAEHNRTQQRQVEPCHTRYRLVGVIEHQGQWCDDGHSIAHIRRPVQTVPTESTRSTIFAQMPSTSADSSRDSLNSSSSSSSSSSTQYEWIVLNDHEISKIVSQLPFGRNCPVAFGYIYIYQQIID